MPEWNIRWQHEYTTRVLNFAGTHQRVTEETIRAELGLDPDIVITRDHVAEYAALDDVIEAQREDADYDQETLHHDPKETRVEEIEEIQPPPPPPDLRDEAPLQWNTVTQGTTNITTGVIYQPQPEPALPVDQRLWGGRIDTVISHTHPAHCECRPCVINREFKTERLRRSKRTKGITTIGVLTGRRKPDTLPPVDEEDTCAECGEVQCTCD